MSQNLRTTTAMRLGRPLLSTALTAITVGPDYSTPKTELAPFHNQVDAFDTASACGSATRSL
jgi:hypothetical protein